MIVLWLLLFLFGGQIVMLLYGEEFAGNGQVIGTIAMAAPFWAVSAVIAVALRAVGRPDIDFRAKIVGLLVTLICSAATVNAWGVPAVAYALVAGSAVSCLFQAWAFYLKVPASSVAK
jgi:O-antigen/teichoic acid export membrane protein